MNLKVFKNSKIILKSILNFCRSIICCIHKWEIITPNIIKKKYNESPFCQIKNNVLEVIIFEKETFFSHVHYL